MNKQQNLYDQLDDTGELEFLPRIRNLSPRERLSRQNRSPNVQHKRIHTSTMTELSGLTDAQETFEFSYKASRHERAWIVDSLGGFQEGQWLDDVQRLLKGGKEASVYQCLANPAVALPSAHIAAKVYRPRQFRNLKNDQLYREGRARLDEDGNEIIDHGLHHAMDKRTEYGKNLMHTSWIEHEYKTMQILHAAGADIPTPYTRGDNAILMEYIGGNDMPAPTLNTVKLDQDEAVHLFECCLHNVDLMLANQRVHGDLSAFNILYWKGEITLIDFPQAIDPNQNRSAYLIFKRDMRRLCEYFTRQGVEYNPRETAAEMWTSHGYHIRPNIHPSLLDDQDEDDYAYWQRLSQR